MTNPEQGSIEKRMTPFGLKMITDSSDKYRRAYKSYAFGMLRKVSNKMIFLIVGIVIAVIVILYLTGYIGR